MEQENFIIRGVTEDGKRLRPGDWIERICSSLTAFSERHCQVLQKSVHPCMIEGEKCLLVTRNMAGKYPEAYKFVMGFAETNKLKIEDGCVGNRVLG